MVLRYKDIHVSDNNKTMKMIYSMYRAGEDSVHRACCKRATQPYLLGGGGTIYPGSRPAGVTTCSPRIVIECFLTRSMLIKMYKYTISWYVPVYIHCIYSKSISCRRSLSLFSLSNCINVFVWYNNSIRKHEYEFITTITIQFGKPFQSELSSSDFLMFNILVLFTYFDVRARLASSIWDFFQTRGPYWLGEGPT